MGNSSLRAFATSLCGLVAVLALCASVYAQRGINYQYALPEADPARLVYFEYASANEGIIDAASDTGQIINLSGANNTLTTGTLAVSGQPAFPREIFLATSDAAGTTLDATFTITYTGVDGYIYTDTVLLEGDATFVFPTPAVSVGAWSVDVENSATSDKVVAGFRGIHVLGTWPNSASDIISERYDGDAPSTAATVPQAGFILPDTSEHSGFATTAFSGIIRTDATSTGYNFLRRVGGAQSRTFTDD